MDNTSREEKHGRQALLMLLALVLWVVAMTIDGNEQFAAERQRTGEVRP